jgi:hypothetical protein
LELPGRKLATIHVAPERRPAAPKIATSRTFCTCNCHLQFGKHHYTGGHEARAGIGEWMIFYNTRRFHQALGYKTPMAVWSAGKTAMDMPLRLDNAIALPTCPQPQQQMQTAIAA